MNDQNDSNDMNGDTVNEQKQSQNQSLNVNGTENEEATADMTDVNASNSGTGAVPGDDAVDQMSRELADLVVSEAIKEDDSKENVNGNVGGNVVENVAGNLEGVNPKPLMPAMSAEDLESQLQSQQKQQHQQQVRDDEDEKPGDDVDGDDNGNLDDLDEEALNMQPKNITPELKPDPREFVDEDPNAAPEWDNDDAAEDATTFQQVF